MRVKIEKVLFDPRIDTSVVLLKDLEQERTLPIWVGPHEALAIIMELEKVTLGRPLTHDLLKNTIEALGATVQWVQIRDLVDSTFLAYVHLVNGDAELDIDSRPSDAIALAVRTAAPIFVAEKVFEEAAKTGGNANLDASAVNEDFLANLPDDVFGKYKM